MDAFENVLNEKLSASERRASIIPDFEVKQTTQYVYENKAEKFITHPSAHYKRLKHIRQILNAILILFTILLFINDNVPREYQLLSSNDMLHVVMAQSVKWLIIGVNLVIPYAVSSEKIHISG